MRNADTYPEPDRVPWRNGCDGQFVIRHSGHGWDMANVAFDNNEELSLFSEHWSPKVVP